MGLGSSSFFCSLCMGLGFKPSFERAGGQGGKAWTLGGVTEHGPTQRTGPNKSTLRGHLGLYVGVRVKPCAFRAEGGGELESDFLSCNCRKSSQPRLLLQKAELFWAKQASLSAGGPQRAPNLRSPGRHAAAHC